MITFDKKNIRFYSMLGQRGTCGFVLADLAQQNENILCMTADLCTTSGLDRFCAAHPQRMLNVGIAEQNMVGVAAGLAMDGYQVFTSTFATFASMRAVEQLRTILAYMKLNVKVIGMASGFSMGFFGNTHYSMEDLSMTRAIPNLTILSPADAAETAKIIIKASQTDSPCYIRLTGAGNMPMVYTEDYELQIGKAIKLKAGSDICFIATGSMVFQAIQAAAVLEKQGLSSTVYNFHTIKPLDYTAVAEACATHKVIVTVEEHSIIGGLGAAVAEYLSQKQSHPRHLKLGVQDIFPHAGDYAFLIEQCGLSAEKIAEQASCKFDIIKKV